MPSFRLELPDVDDTYALADWFEVSTLISGVPQVSRAEISETLVAKTGATPQELEARIGFVLAEIGRRRDIAGSAYPFSLDGTMVKVDASANPEFYKFLLLISINGPMRSKRRFAEIDEIFDKIVCEAARNYFGEGAVSLRFGFPPSDGRPKSFSKALDWLSVKMEIPRGSGRPPRASKDGGLDVVAWKPFPDHRTAFATMFIQCTIQSDWYSKADDIRSDVWCSRIDTGPSMLTSLAIPFVIRQSYDKWDDLRRKVSIVFDRLRLARMLEKQNAASFRKMTSWSKKEIAKVTV